VVIIELKDQTMTDFIFLETIQIEAQYPNIKDKDSCASPSWKVTGENWSILNALASIDDNENNGAKHNDTGPNTHS